MGKNNITEIKGWEYISGPHWWTGEDAMWVRKAKDGAWFVLRFQDLRDAGGSDFEDTPYECDVRRVHLKELSEEEIGSALRSSGWHLGPDGCIYQEVWERDGKKYGGDLVCDKEHAELCIVECLVSHGLGAPLHDETGKRYDRVRGRARAEAVSLMRDAEALEEALDRPVNAIGSTAREYGRGDINSALYRDTPGTNPTAMGIMRKMHGIERVENTVTFGTLTEAGLTDVRHIKQSAMLACPHAIMMPTHYREDSSCKCDDAIERRMMIKEWGYKAKDFEGIPIRGLGEPHEVSQGER
jgi:hypothetical protein